MTKYLCSQDNSNLESLKLKKLTKGENIGKVFIIMVKGGLVKKQEK